MEKSLLPVLSNAQLVTSNFIFIPVWTSHIKSNPNNPFGFCMAIEINVSKTLKQGHQMNMVLQFSMKWAIRPKKNSTLDHPKSFRHNKGCQAVHVEKELKKMVREVFMFHA